MKVEVDQIKHIWVVGAGGVGFWLAVALGRESYGRKVTVWDDDTFEGGNGFRRLPAVEDPGQWKVDYLKGFEVMVMGDAAPSVLARRLTVEDVRGVDLRDTLIIDCTDMGLPSRRELWEACEASGAQMMRVSYDGNGIVYAGWGLPLGGTDRGGYAELPRLGQSFLAAGLASEMIHQLLGKGWIEQDQVVEITGSEEAA